MVYCWSMTKLSSCLNFSQPSTEHGGISARHIISHQRQIHHVQRSYEILKQDELKHWGLHTYYPNRILCAVPTTWNYSAHRIRRIQDTWGPLCDTLIFAVASEHKKPINVTVGEILVVNMTRSASPKDRNIWEKSHLMWRAVADKYINKAEWFLKVDDDTFLFPDHLRGFTEFYNPNIPRYFGHTIMHRWKNENIVFNTGLAYVLSREALLQLAVLLRNMPSWKPGLPVELCHDRKGAGEDSSISICLKNVGIIPDNTLDQQGRQRFFPFQLQAHYSHKRDDEESWFWKYKPKIVGTEENCCVPKEEVIAVHGYKRIGDDEEFYKLHAQALASRNHVAPIPPKPSSFWYDKELLDFEVDEWHNSLAAAETAAKFTGYTARR